MRNTSDISRKIGANISIAFVMISVILCHGCGLDSSTPGISNISDSQSSAELDETGIAIDILYPTLFGEELGLSGTGHPDLSWDEIYPCTWQEYDEATQVSRFRCQLDSDSTEHTLQVKPRLYSDAYAFWSKGANAVLDANHDTMLTPFFFEELSRTEFKTFEATAQEAVIILPPGYDENPAISYDIIYMLDGQNIVDAMNPVFGTSWKADRALESVALSEYTSIAPAIIVAFTAGDNESDRTEQYTFEQDAAYGGGRADAFLEKLTGTYDDFFTDGYRISSDARRSIVGSSLGGLFSIEACIKRPMFFDGCASMSPALWWNERSLITRLSVEGLDQDRFYLDSGASGSYNDGVEDVRILLDAMHDANTWRSGYQHIEVRDHAHNEWAWQQRLPGVLQYLMEYQ